MDLRGGPPPELGIGGIGGAQSPQVPGLLQMAQAAMGGDGRGGGPMGQQYENAWDNPANWGPPPPMDPRLNKDNFLQQQGYFPGVFQQGRPQTGKFFSMDDYLGQYYDKFGMQRPEVMEGGQSNRHINTLNPAMLGGARGPAEQGSFMYLGHQISPTKLYYDLHRPVSDPITAGSIHYAKQFGPSQTAWSTTGELGLPGQLEPFATQWGAGGPG